MDEPYAVDTLIGPALYGRRMAEIAPGAPNTGSRIMESTAEWKRMEPPKEGAPTDDQMRELAKAAKLRRRAAGMRARAARLQDRTRALFDEAAGLDRRADGLDGGFGRPPEMPPTD